jgi:hypothetical protein
MESSFLKLHVNIKLAGMEPPQRRISEALLGEVKSGKRDVYV